MEAKREKAAQVEPVSNGDHKGGRGNQGGIRAASKELGIDRNKARRAVNIATKLTPEAKAFAIDYGMADNQSALERKRQYGLIRASIEEARGRPEKNPEAVRKFSKTPPIPSGGSGFAMRVRGRVPSRLLCRRYRPADQALQ
jgi:hypothetical protein